MDLRPTYQIAMVLGGVVVLDSTSGEDGEMHGARVFGTIEQACAYIVKSGQAFESDPDAHEEIDKALKEAK